MIITTWRILWIPSFSSLRLAATWWALWQPTSASGPMTRAGRRRRIGASIAPRPRPGASPPEARGSVGHAADRRPGNERDQGDALGRAWRGRGRAGRAAHVPRRAGLGRARCRRLVDVGGRRLQPRPCRGRRPVGRGGGDRVRGGAGDVRPRRRGGARPRPGPAVVGPPGPDRGGGAGRRAGR